MTNFYASGPVDTKAVKVRKPRKGLTKLILGKNAVPTFSQKLKNVKEAKIKNFKSSVSAKLKNVWTQFSTFKYNDPFNEKGRKAPFSKKTKNVR